MPALILMKILQSYISSGALFAKGGFVIKKRITNSGIRGLCQSCF